ncbi:hypothetical protein D0Z66_17150 [Cereibacter sphaeroides]|nr:hypothetical protein D0Z66_17150 [Cereibacter sphaeroides]
MNSSHWMPGTYRLSSEQRKAARRALLFAVIDQMLLEGDNVKLPRSLHPDLKAEVTQAEGPVAWAVWQPDFEHIMAGRLRKKRANAPGTDAGPAERPSQWDPIVRRARAMRDIFDLRVNGADASPLPRIDTDILKEMRAAGGPFQWLMAQPGVRALVRARYRKPAAAEVQPRREVVPSSCKLVPPFTATTSMSLEEIMVRGKARLLILPHKLTPDELDALTEAVGILPSPPGRGSSRKERSKLRKAWEARLDDAQRAAWNGLLPQQQEDYTMKGVITVGKRSKTLRRLRVNSASHAILRKASAIAREEWDIRKIDWSST